MGMYNFSQKFSVIGEIFSENLSGIKFLDSLCSVFTPMMHYWISWTSLDWSRKHQRNQIRHMYRIASRTWLIGLHGNCYHSTVPNVARCRISVFIDFCLRHVCCFNMLLDIIYRKQMLSKSELQHCIFFVHPSYSGDNLYIEKSSFFSNIAITAAATTITKYNNPYSRSRRQL